MTESEDLFDVTNILAEGIRLHHTNVLGPSRASSECLQYFHPPILIVPEAILYSPRQIPTYIDWDGASPES